MKIKVDNSQCIPKRAHSLDAGADLIAKELTWMPKYTRVLVKTGVYVEIQPGYVGLLVPRSSLSKNDIIMTNSVGVIDSEYRGEIMASLMYTGIMDNYCIQQGTKIVQLLVVPIALPEFEVVNELNDTARGVGGFGSTG
jgi:dUTP pyrophosphatase